MSSRVSTLGSWNYYSVPSFLLGSPLCPLRGLVVVLCRLCLHPSPPCALVPPPVAFYTPRSPRSFRLSVESINQRSSGAPCYRHDERWKYRAHARDITEARLGYIRLVCAPV